MTSRREFLVRGGALAFACTPLARWRARQASPDTLRLAFIDDGAVDARDGFTLGVEEARHAAELFGGGVAWTVARPHTIGAELRRSGAVAVIGGAGVETARALARDAAGAGAIYMNTLVSDDALRSACPPLTFHVVPSDRMFRDARALAHAVDAAPAEAWDASLVKFGADTLNNRFRARFGRAMTAASWTNWFAVKALWESMLRAQTADARALSAHLSDDSTQFDGHKGRPLGFRPWDRQLRQPVYVRVAEGRPLVEEPVQGPNEDARASLDKIGADAKEECRHD